LTLKIEIARKGKFASFTLIGRINADEVVELQRFLEAEENCDRIVVDLKEVNLVDREGVRFLSWCEGNGAQLRNCPAYVREWIEKERFLQPQ
jgi:hypothetical protein